MSPKISTVVLPRKSLAASHSNVRDGVKIALYAGRRIAGLCDYILSASCGKENALPF